jgi:site-specific recombinase XerD
MTALAPILQGYFTDRLAALQASPETVRSYRDTYRLLLTYLQTTTGTPPSRLDLSDLHPGAILGFLDHLETSRGNGIATRNLRLTAIHSLFRYAALRCPEHAELIARVLAVPNKRPTHRIVSYLTRRETVALLAAPDQKTALGRRDHLLLTVAVQTGLRISELIGLDCADFTVGVGAHLRCTGKGRKDRTTPLTQPTAEALRRWVAHRRAALTDPLFATRSGGRLSPDAVADLLAKHVTVAARHCPSLTAKNVTPHTLRHTCAMNLLHAGVDPNSIALWLGHASPRSTQPYLHADLQLKERTLAQAAPPGTGSRRYQPGDSLLAFLEAL